MTDIQKTARPLDKRPIGRGSYTRPALKEFGSIGALTQAGNGSVNEMSLGNEMCELDLMKALC